MIALNRAHAEGYPITVTVGGLDWASEELVELLSDTTLTPEQRDTVALTVLGRQFASQLTLWQFHVHVTDLTGPNAWPTLSITASIDVIETILAHFFRAEDGV